MINILFSRKRNRIEINFNGPHFYDILDFVKEQFLSYEGDYRIWTAPVKKIYRILPDFKDLDEVYIDDNVLRFFREALSKTETKYVRREFSPELLKLPPIKGISPNENYQIEDIIRGIRQNRLYLAHEQGLGKFQSINAKIYTPDGFVLMKDIKIGDEIINSDGEISIVEAIYPQGKKKLYEIVFTDGSKTTSGEEHLWAVQTSSQKYRNQGFKVKTLKDIKNDYNSYKYGCKYYIPMVKPIKFKERNLIVDSYLMGCLIADGCFRKISTIGYTKHNNKIVNYIKNKLPKNDVLSSCSEKGEFLIAARGDRSTTLKEIIKLKLYRNKSIEKFIPDIYKYNSIENRVSLLQGLMDSDGSYEKNKAKGNKKENFTPIYYTSSKQLAYDVKELVETLGGNAFLTVKENPKYVYKNEVKFGKTVYRIVIRLPDNIIPFKNTNLHYKPNIKYKPMRGIKKINYLGIKECQCIKTSAKNGLYVTDDCIITHNTYILTGIINHLYDKEFDKIMIVAPPIAIYNWKREIFKFSNLFKEEDIFIADRFNRRPFDSNPKIILLTYRSFLLLSDDYYKIQNPRGKSKKYQKPTIPFSSWGNKRCIILDEAHNIKGKTSRQTHVILLHKNYFEFRYEASGTPDPNGVEGLWTQLHFLDENLVGDDYYDWIREIAYIGNRYSKYAITGYKYDKVETFIKKTTSHVIRRLSKDHLDLPELYIKKIYVRLSKKQKKLYKHVCNYVLSEVDDQRDNGLKIKDETMFHETRRTISKFPYIFQALDNPCLLSGKIESKKSPILYNFIENWKFKDHSKLEITEYLLNQYIKEEKRKVILWSGHPLTIEQLQEYFCKYKPFIIHGQIGVGNPAIRDEILENFKKNKKRNLLIASYLVIKTAINLVEVSRSIYFDRSHDYEPWSQSIKRIHRIGQKERVIVNPLIFEKSINSQTILPEQKQDGRLEFRNTLNNNLFNREALTIGEWRKIFDGEDIFNQS